MNDWIEWNGGPMPVDGEQGVCVKKSLGGEYGGKAKDFNWEVVDGELAYTTIEAYRVLGQEKIQPNKTTETMEAGSVLGRLTEENKIKDSVTIDRLNETIELQSSIIQSLTRDKENYTLWVDRLINALGK